MHVLRRDLGQRSNGANTCFDSCQLRAAIHTRISDSVRDQAIKMENQSIYLVSFSTEDRSVIMPVLTFGRGDRSRGS